MALTTGVMLAMFGSSFQHLALEMKAIVAQASQPGRVSCWRVCMHRLVHSECWNGRGGCFQGDARLEHVGRRSGQGGLLSAYFCSSPSTPVFEWIQIFFPLQCRNKSELESERAHG